LPVLAWADFTTLEDLAEATVVTTKYPGIIFKKAPDGSLNQRRIFFCHLWLRTW
jgi:hypothetical protein